MLAVTGLKLIDSVVMARTTMTTGVFPTCSRFRANLETENRSQDLTRTSQICRRFSRSLHRVKVTVIAVIPRLYGLLKTYLSKRQGRICLELENLITGHSAAMESSLCKWHGR